MYWQRHRNKYFCEHQKQIHARLWQYFIRIAFLAGFYTPAHDDNIVVLILLRMYFINDTEKNISHVKPPSLAHAHGTQIQISCLYFSLRTDIDFKGGSRY